MLPLLLRQTNNFTTEEEAVMVAAIKVTIVDVVEDVKMWRKSDENPRMIADDVWTRYYDVISLVNMKNEQTA